MAENVGTPNHSENANDNRIESIKIDPCRRNDETEMHITSLSQSPNTMFSKSLSSHSNLHTNSLGLGYNLTPYVRDSIERSFFNHQHKLAGQRDAIVSLTLSDLGKAFVEKDYPKISPISEFYNLILRTSYSTIFGRFNNVADIINRARTRKCMGLVVNIDDLLQQINIECTEAKQELNILENKNSVDIENLKCENAKLLEELNETKTKLQKGNETLFYPNHHIYENEIVINQNKSINANNDKSQSQNQNLKEQLESSLNKTKTMLDEYLKVVKDQVEIINKIQIYKESNDTLKKDYIDSKELNTNLEKINTNLKFENAKLLEELNETKMKLLKEKEIASYLKQCVDENKIVFNQNKSINAKYDKIQLENHSLKELLHRMKNSWDQTKTMLDEYQSKIKDQVDIINKLQIYKESNDTLKKDNFDLMERSKYVEKINTELIDKNKIQEEKFNTFEDTCKNYVNLIKIKDQKLMDLDQQLVFQTENNDKLIALQEKEKLNNDLLITSLKNQLFDLQQCLNLSVEKRDSFLIKYNALEKEKIQQENQSKEYLKEIEKLKAECYLQQSLKKKQQYVMAEKNSLENKKNEQEKQNKEHLKEIEKLKTKCLISDYEGHNIGVNDFSQVEFSDWNLSKSDHQNGFTAIKINENNSNIKRNLQSIPPESNLVIKKSRTADNLAASQIECKSKAKKKCASVLKHSQSRQINKTQPPQIIDTIELSDDEGNNIADNDCSQVEFNDWNVSKTNLQNGFTAIKINQNNSNIKKIFPSIPPDSNLIIKKSRTAASQKKTKKCTKKSFK